MHYVKSIHIKNFRSILDERIDLSDYNCFVGKNDSGKSNVLKALNLFFNGKSDYSDTKFDIEKDFCKFANHNKRAKEIEISLTIEIPKNFKDSGEVVWIKKWRKDGEVENNLNDLSSGEKSRTRAFLSKIQYQYVPAFKSIEYFKSLLICIYESLTKTANAALSTQNSLYSKTLQGALIKLSSDLRNRIGLTSLIQMPKDMTVLFKDLSFSTSDNVVKDVDLNQRGDGIKARHIPSILASIQDNLKVQKNKTEVNYSFIWGFEEPENGLEFGACYELAKELNEYLAQCQIMITTHSPVFYSNCGENGGKLYRVSKQNGKSDYNIISKSEDLNEEVGFMELVAPFIKAEHDRYNEIQAKYDSLQKTINASKKKILIFTEGKTDVIHLKSAKEALKNKLDLDFQAMPDMNGDADLDAFLEKIKRVNQKTKIVGIFDLDNPKYVEKYGSFKDLGNNVYAFCIPLVNEAIYGRSISIEHYYKKETLFSEIKGRRLFLGEEFFNSGNSKDGNYLTRISQIQNKVNVNGIIDEKVYKRDDLELLHSIALTKNDFANAINSHEIVNVDFSEFNRIFDILQKISLSPLKR